MRNQDLLFQNFKMNAKSSTVQVYLRILLHHINFFFSKRPTIDIGAAGPLFETCWLELLRPQQLEDLTMVQLTKGK